MTDTSLKPLRRVVTGNDEKGKSKVMWDGSAPNAHTTDIPGRGHTDLWVWNESPALLLGREDAGNLSYDFSGAPRGAHWRVIHAQPRPDNCDRANDPNVVPAHEPNFCIILEDVVVLGLDTHEVRLKAGEFVVQRGTNHAWSNRSNHPAVVAIASHDGAA